MGIGARETNNIIERKHGTLKDGLRPSRGLKHDNGAAKTWLAGYIVNYNFVKPLKGIDDKTPAQAAALNVKAYWGSRIKKATVHLTKGRTSQ